MVAMERGRCVWNRGNRQFLGSLLVGLVMIGSTVQGQTPGKQGLAAEHAASFAKLALDCVVREYPNKIAHTMESDEQLKPPRELHPVFYGCFDWHSAVHGHWLLVRVLRFHPNGPMAARIEAALNQNITDERVVGEVAYFHGNGRAAYERPYGLAWLLQLCAELREWDDPRAKTWLSRLAPLEQVCADRFRDWLPKLAYPIRTGEHSQTAFAFGLVWDWAVGKSDQAMQAMLREKAEAFYFGDRQAPLAYEPSGQDFLSPVLAEADFMRRVLSTGDYAAWLGSFMPQIPLKGGADWLPIGVVTDPGDGKLAHLDGLNLSRAWMLEGIASALPNQDPRKKALMAAAKTHRDSGLSSVTGAHYEGGHWLGSFATYLVSRRGIR